MSVWLKWLVPVLALGAMAIVFDAAASAQDAAPATQPTTQPMGSVKVTVNGEDGKPASGVTVTIARGRGRRGGGGGGGGGAAAGGGGGRRGGPPIATGTTDDTGIVTLSNIPVQTAPYNVTARSGDGSLRGRGTVTVTADAPAEVTITLAPGRGGGGGAAPAPAPAPTPAPGN